MNKILLIGRLGKDPETRTTPGGKSVANFTMATDSGYGEKRVTQWHRIVAWEKTAELAQKYLHKGSKIFLEGEVQYGSYEKNGQTHYTTDIVARNIQFLDAKSLDNPKTDVPSNFGSAEDIPFICQD
jgi:single-strand DNA-binding protein